eukprot:jgi/Picre1/34080/NNA_001555.t1
MLNLAACCQKNSAFGEAIEWCERALSEHPESTKAYFRRAKAKQSMSLFEEALDDLNQIVKIDSSLEEDVAREKAILRRKARAASQKQKQEFSNFFSQ